MLLLFGCQDPLAEFNAPHATPSPRPATKTTCSEPTLTWLPPGVEAVERELKPYGPDLMGLEVMHADDAGDRSILVVAGGYMDEIIEAYDDLEPKGRIRVAGKPAVWLAGSLLDRPINVAVWFEDEPEPCEVRVVLTDGLGSRAFRTLARGIR